MNDTHYISFRSHTAGTRSSAWFDANGFREGDVSVTSLPPAYEAACSCGETFTGATAKQASRRCEAHVYAHRGIVRGSVTA